MADATTLTEAGYVGEDVENIMQKLLQKCDYDIEKRKKELVYIDEVIKFQEKLKIHQLPEMFLAKGFSKLY